jgi:hypothetical protein
VTMREAFRSVVRGGSPEPKLIMTLDGDAESAVRLGAPTESQIGLAEIMSPVARLNSLEATLESLSHNPEVGNVLVDHAVKATRSEISERLAAGYEGIFYRLVGAEPSKTTPMQYGGFFLERDREILSALPEGAIRVIFIDAGEEAYLDFVSDLPGDLFAWDYARTSIAPEAVRPMRTGALATNHPEADVFFAATRAELNLPELSTHA